MNHEIAVLIKGYNELGNSLTGASAAVNAFSATSKSAANAINSAMGNIRAPDTKSFEDAARQFEDLGKKALVAGGLGVAGLGMTVKSAVGFETAMTRVSTLVDSATTDMGALAGSVRKLSAQIGAVPAETAGTLAAVIKGGFRDAASATAVLEGSMRLADASFGDMAETANVLTAIMNAYGKASSRWPPTSGTLYGESSREPGIP